MKTPLKADVLCKLLIQSQYKPDEIEFLNKGITKGFDIGYQGNKEVKLTSNNLKFIIGDETVLWNKVMKEVANGRYAGPYDYIPFDNYIQSPLGLVPKDGGKDVRLIFHLSHPRNPKSGIPESVNANTPKELCSVKYPSFDDAVMLCIINGRSCLIAKSDLKSAFRNLGIKPDCWCYLVMMAIDPETGKRYYFVDKCLLFGAAISCALFQRVSNAIAHIVMYRTGQQLINYLDDYFFAALLKMMCNGQVDEFLKVCSAVNFPVALDKTFRATTQLVFLGLLINTVSQTVHVPIEKIKKALDLLHRALNKKPSKMRLIELQQLCGTLNFICLAVLPGRAFIRRLYKGTSSKTGKKLKSYHHIRIDKGIKQDMNMWILFLNNPVAVSRPFLDFSRCYTADEIEFYTDASANPSLGCGGYCGKSWYAQQWNEKFILDKEPSIVYLELYAVTVAVLNWIDRFQNKRVIIFCDNKSVVHMINSMTSHSLKCMTLIRLIVLQGMISNVRIFAKHVPGKLNKFSDMLSRREFEKFFKLAEQTNKQFEERPTPVPELLWPMEKIFHS